MKNLTISVDPKAAAWARRKAGKQGMSVSRFVGDLLAQSMERDTGYEAAMQRFFAEEPLAFAADSKRPTRDELNDRASLR